MVGTGAREGAKPTTMANWNRYETTDPTLHGPWVLADDSFASVGGRAIGSISTPGFYSLPDPRPGEPTHIINGGMGGSFYLAQFDAAREKLSNLSSRSYSVGGSWSVAGKSESDGSILHMGWVGFGNAPSPVGLELDMMSLVRVLSFDRASQSLVTNPIPSYTALRTGTLARGTNLQLLPGAPLHTPSLAPGAGAAIDILVVLNLTTGEALAFELQLLADQQGGSMNATSGLEIGAGSLGVNVSATTAADGSRSGLLSYRGTTYHGTQPFTVLQGEATVELRVLVDRVIVEAFAQHGRAQLTAHEWGAEGNTAVHMRSAGAQPAVLSTYEIFGMGCGWL